MTLEGIDISTHQTTTPSLTGRDFAFVRATYGTSPDLRYTMHAGNVRKAGKVLGAYHFGRNALYGAVSAQVDSFLAAAKGADLLAVDLEADGDNQPMSLAQCREFIDRVQATGRRIGLYRSESVFRDLGQDWNWVANWSREPSITWTFWQYRGSPLDLDRFHGDAAKLKALCDITPPDTSTGDPMALNITNEAYRLIRVNKGARIADLNGSAVGTASDTFERLTLYEVSVGGTAYYVARLPGASPGPDVLLVRKADCADLGPGCPPPPADTSPFTQADIDKAVADAIAADRAKAHVAVVYD